MVFALQINAALKKSAPAKAPKKVLHLSSFSLSLFLSRLFLLFLVSKTTRNSTLRVLFFPLSSLRAKGGETDWIWAKKKERKREKEREHKRTTALRVKRDV